jgi:hypothetical protein
MKTIATPIAVLVVCLLVALPVFAAIPVRHSSDNGVDSIADLWNLFGPTEIRTLTKGTIKVNYKQQVVCPGQDVASVVNPSDSLHAGGCEGPSNNGTNPTYLFIYQLRSSATNVTVQLGNLVGFTADGSVPTYGVVLCDPSNTLELCTTATQAQLPNITFSPSTPGTPSTTATFVIPSFPKFPNGTKHQGQGMTIFVVTHQTATQPIALPTITLK